MATDHAPRGELLLSAPRGVHRVEFVMGLPVSVDLCDPGVGEGPVAEVFRWLRWVDVTFSTYRAESTISRLNRGELGLGEAHPVVGRVLARCRELADETDGFFDIAAPYRDDRGAPDAGRGRPGSVEPSGFVKGWAVAEAAAMLRRAGARNFAVNAGGDIEVAGRPDGGSAWRVGIQHPRLADAIAMTLQLSDRAVATSGSYARGEHIVDPRGGRAAAGLLSVTITGPDLATADAYATAVCAMGAQRGAAWCARLGDYDAILICADETVLTTPGIDSLRVSEPGHD